MIDEIATFTLSISILTFALWNILAIMPERRQRRGTHLPLSVVIPAHNEESCIGSTIRSVFAAKYSSDIEVLVIDDGSTDATASIVASLRKDDPRVRILKTDHLGKAMAVNHGVQNCTGEIVVILDADSKLENDSLDELVQPFSDPSVGGASGIVRVELNNNPLVWFQDYEYVLSSMWRYIFDKIGCTYILPGFAAFRRKALIEAGGFEIDTLSEDFDIGLKLRKASWTLMMTRAVMHTTPPQTLGGIAKQRMRWGRGTFQVIKKHKDMVLNPKYGWIGLYGLPNQIYFFAQGLISLPMTLYQVFSGYSQFFIQYGTYFNWDVIKYFFGWMSIWGGLEYSYKVFAGIWAPTPVFPLFFASFVLNYSYSILAAKKMRGLSIRLIFAFCLAFPYYLFTLTFFVYPMLLELNPLRIRPRHMNIWEKNR